jgi:hypothetical protein
MMVAMPRIRLRTGRYGLVIPLVLAASAVLKTGCDGPADPSTASGGSSQSGQVSPAAKPVTGSALEALADLAVKGRAPKTGYSRDQFGPAWSDTDHNGCDTRNDVLHRQLTAVTTKAGTHNCIVLTGVLADPYTGKRIVFKRGEKTSDAVQVDHVVAESDAWQTGAQQLSAGRRLQFANDPINLIAVDGPTNQSKGDSDAATWLPKNKAYRCAYVARQIKVKATYGLWVTAAEKAAMVRVLVDCHSQPVPAGPAGPKG